MPKFSFIGAGRMGGAIVRGLIRSGACQPSDIKIIGGANQSAKDLAKETGVILATSDEELFSGSDAVIVACKPQQFPLLNSAYGALAKDKLVLSVLAGTRLANLTQFFKSARNVVRTMPNTPGAIGKGVTAICSVKPLSGGDKQIVDVICNGLGKSLEMPESQFDAVTAVSGSGPGFFFEYLSAYEDAAVSLGFTCEQAQLLVRETFMGSLALLQSTKESPDDLRNQVTSPGGTTRAGLDALAKNQFREAVKSALVAAQKRSEELGK
jgi:pyrroline-5-carboxylate reductase